MPVKVYIPSEHEDAAPESTAIVKHESISLIATARQQLAKASTVQEVKSIRDKSAALQVYLRQQRESLDAQQACSEIKLRAERRAGDLLREMQSKKERAGRGGDKKSKAQREPLIAPTLESLGIGRLQAQRWQREALVPESAFEAYVATTRAKGEELTQAGLLRLAKDPQQARGAGDAGELRFDVPAFCDKVREWIVAAFTKCPKGGRTALRLAVEQALDEAES